MVVVSGVPFMDDKKQYERKNRSWTNEPKRVLTPPSHLLPFPSIFKTIQGLNYKRARKFIAENGRIHTIPRFLNIFILFSPPIIEILC